ncbi:alpha/beta hydrolase-fold protein [Spongiimicrobium salis]|uniref:alpha/beta hydrolase-fold protein n=1 Tax=Spongiimicrobium salis TaxID=1667022 RepID=UPI00374D4ECF
MKQMLLLCCLISLNTLFAQGKLEFARTEVIPIKDTETGRSYELYIRLPEKYLEEEGSKHPVIYYTDALWHVETLSGATEYIMEDAILVGISWEKNPQGTLDKIGAHGSRFRDYTSRKSENAEHQAKYHFGQAANHLTFIREDVIPYVESNYRTDPSNRTYFGYSLSAEFGAYILLTQPHTFKNYILGSPSLMGEIPNFSKLAANAEQNHKSLDAHVFISYGSLEDTLGKHTEEFIGLLKNRKDKSLTLKREVIEGTHQTAFPEAVVHGIHWLAKKMNFPVLEGAYLGQTTPQLIPEIFAPDIISIKGRYEHGISFSPDLNEVYFSANKDGGAAAIYFSKLEGGKWTRPEKAALTQGKKEEEMHPFVSANGEKLYFTGLNFDNTDVKIWSADRSGDSWGEAKVLNSPINEDKVFYPNMGKNGDLFYFNVSKRKMYIAPKENNEFPKVREMKIPFGVHGFIAPSQDFMLVNARNPEDKERRSDIYVYFKKKDHSWSRPINLGSAVNTSFSETCPSVTPDGKYLFFSRYNEEGGLSDFYWVSTEVIHKLKPANL